MFTNVTLLYFLLLIPLSGFIAWIGDRIGHRSGKKRHTLFGMRPRHTAMFFTIGAGVCIALLSFVSVWALSETFRIVLRDGATLVLKNHDLKQENSRLNAGNDSLRGEAGKLLDQARVSRERADSSAREARTADNRRDAAVTRWHLAQSQADRAERDLDRETRTLRERETALAQARENLLALKTQLGTKARELQSAVLKVSFYEKQVVDAHARVADALTKETAAADDLARVRREADDALSIQQHNLTDLRQQLADQSKLYDEQTLKIAAQRKALDQVSLQVKAGERDLALIRENIGALRGKQIAYQVGEEVNRIDIRPGYNIWRIETILGAFLNTTGKRAEARGALKTHDGEERAVVILPKILAGDGAADDPHVITEDDSIRAAADAIRRANVEVVVLAKATANSVAGEPVPVEFKIYKNPVVIPAETRITEAAIDGNGSRQQIAREFDEFLSQKVRRSLLQAGLIPPARGGEVSEDSAAGAAAAAAARGAKAGGIDAGGPATAASSGAETAGGGEPGASLVSLSNDEWLQIMDHVREAGGHARVVAIASGDMRAGDPAKLRFEVKGGFGGAQSSILRSESGF